MYDCCTSQSKTKVIRIDFGRVRAGSVAKRTVKILNESCKKQYYQVRRDPKTNPLDHVFTMEFNNCILISGGSGECKIEYHPMLPSRCNVDYFSISDCDRICYKIVVQGTCIGPNVISSVSRLVMIRSKTRLEDKKRLQLTNDSEAQAIFMFDIDQTNCPFKLDSTRGTIGPNNRIYVTITFSPRQQGFYAFYLPCLILYQGLIITELYGYQGSLFSKTEEFIPLIFSDPKPPIRNFEDYMCDAVKILKDGYPPISVDNNFLDFGRGEFNSNKDFQCLPKNVCLTNHSTTDLIVEWDKDSEGIFEIKPRRATICSQRSGLFEVYFLANKPDTLFSRELIVRAFWKPEVPEASSQCTLNEPVPIPLLASVRMIGQSFSPGSIGWIPQYEVPSIVILPPCLPPLPVYTTFLIKLYGHLAMTFRFIPPTTTTRFAVKPMVGIITREYQIVALQMFPEVQGELLYTERWTIQFNGNSKNEVPIDFKASVEYPKLDFNNNNKVEFAPVYPRCEQVSQVTLRNLTRHCIRYSFPNLPSDISMAKINGIIQANEKLTHDWIFSPRYTGDHSYTILCRVTTLKAGCPVGIDIDVPIKIAGRAEHGYLVALPEELNFGTVIHGQTKKLSFHTFNFSSVPIHYKLICKQRSCPIGDVKRDVRIQPVTGTIYPGGNERIDVYLTPQEPGFYQLMTRYSLRSNSSAKDVLRTVDARNICILNCMCILPGFEVKDLLYLSFREHISKALLWNLLKVDEFNVITKSILPGAEKVIDLRFPEIVVSQEPLLIKLLVINSAPVESMWVLTRVKKCDCQQVIKSRGLTFKYKEYCCDHRLACIISPNKGLLQPYEQATISIKVCYVLLGKTSLQWRLKLSDNRNVIINADVVALSDSEARCSLLTNQVSLLDKTYIGDMDGMNQMCWMYNSMDHEATYSLDISPLCRINIKNLNETFSCRNPCGAVPGRTYYPIIFKFQPRRFESYEVTLPLKLGDIWTNILIKAETDILHRTRFLPGKVPSLDQFSIPELPVYFSVDRIVVSPMPMHSKVNRMIMIFNESKNDVIGYQWRRYNMSSVLEMKVIPASGRIQPTKAQSFCITIESLSLPCKITANLCCQFLNLSAQRKYEKSLVMYNSLSEELAGQFIITETGMKEPKPWLKRAEKPKPFYKSLSISCYIYSLTDTDLKATVDEQLKSLPPAEIRIQKNESSARADEKLINIAVFILEGMIWDILNSNLFMNTLKESLAKTPKIKYGQCVIPSIERRKLQNRSYDVPPKQFLASIFEQMILGIVHEEFGLNLYHFNGPKDIRQFCYQKRDERSRKQNKVYKSNSQGSMNQLEDLHKLKSKQLPLESQVKFNVEDDDSSSSESSD